MCHTIGLKSQFKNIIENVPYVPITAGQRKPEGQWTVDERKAANLDQRLKSLIMHVLPDDQMNSVINCLTAKSTWDDLILYYKGPSDVKESRKPKLKPNKDIKAKYNKVKAKLALLSSGISSKSSMVKNKGLVAEAYKWDEEDVSSDDNGMTEVKVFMALADDENVDVGKESTRIDEWVKISMRKIHTLLDMEDNDERKSFLDYLHIDLNYVEEQRNNLVLKHRDLVQELNTRKEQLLVLKQAKLFLPCSIKQIPSQKKRILGLDQLNEDPSSSGQTDLPNHDTADESLVCSTPLPLLEKLAGVEPVSGPKTIKSILKSNSTFKVETLKGVTINEQSSTPTKGNKNGLASKNNSAHAVPQNALQNKYKTQFKRNCKLCGVNNHLSENCYKVLFCKKCERTYHRTSNHAEYMSTMNTNQHHKSQGGFSSRSKTSRPSKPFPPCMHCGFNDHLSDDYVNYPIYDICGSYDHDTHGHNKVISLRRGIKPSNPQQVTKSYETRGSTVHTTTDYNDIE
ncbi:hypothetical protein Tco_0492477 [Tanacetum coccineum]